MLSASSSYRQTHKQSFLLVKPPIALLQRLLWICQFQFELEQQMREHLVDFRQRYVLADASSASVRLVNRVPAIYQQ